MVMVVHDDDSTGARSYFATYIFTTYIYFLTGEHLTYDTDALDDIVEEYTGIASSAADLETITAHDIF